MGVMLISGMVQPSFHKILAKRHISHSFHTHWSLHVVNNLYTLDNFVCKSSTIGKAKNRLIHVIYPGRKTTIVQVEGVYIG